MLFALGSSLCWGTADFFGGLQSRRLPALAVAFWSQLAGGVALLLLLLLGGEPFVRASFGWGLAGGFFGGLGLLFFYRGLATGIMSLVAPIAACGAVVPVLFGLALGETPSLPATIGIVAAIAGIVLVSLQPQAPAHASGRPREALLLALGAALGFGMFFVFLHRGSSVPNPAPLWVVAGARASSLVTLMALIAARPRSAPFPGRRFALVAAVGIVDTTANALFAYASTQGDIGVVSVLGSLYPVATVMLGRLVLAERLNWLQNAGVVLALCGVIMLSAG